MNLGKREFLPRFILNNKTLNIVSDCCFEWILVVTITFLELMGNEKILLKVYYVSDMITLTVHKSKGEKSEEDFIGIYFIFCINICTKFSGICNGDRK